MILAIPAPSFHRPSKAAAAMMLAVFGALALALISPASAQALKVEVKAYNPVSGNEIAAAAPGSKVLVEAKATVPEDAVNQKVTLKISAKLKVVGVSVPYSFPLSSVVAPNTNPKDGGSFLQTGTEKRLFKIPSAAPAGSYIKLTAVAEVLDKTSNQVSLMLKVR